MEKKLFLLWDSWTAVRIVQLMHAGRPDAPSGDTLASYLTESASSQAVVPLEEGQGCCYYPAVLVGRCVFFGIEVWVALPTVARLAYDVSMLWARRAQGELARQYISWCRIAQLQTIGGAYASLRQADKALECAMEMYDISVSLNEGDISRKCRLFIGWAHLWNGNVPMALHLFNLELTDAERRDDIMQERRCQHAIINATTNPTLQPGTAQRHFSLTDCWTNAFSSEEIVDY